MVLQLISSTCGLNHELCRSLSSTCAWRETIPRLLLLVNHGLFKDILFLASVEDKIFRTSIQKNQNHRLKNNGQHCKGGAFSAMTRRFFEIGLSSFCPKPFLLINLRAVHSMLSGGRHLFKLLIKNLTACVTRQLQNIYLKRWATSIRLWQNFCSLNSKNKLQPKLAQSSDIDYADKLKFDQIMTPNRA